MNKEKMGGRGKLLASPVRHLTLSLSIDLFGHILKIYGTYKRAARSVIKIVTMEGESRVEKERS